MGGNMSDAEMQLWVERRIAEENERDTEDEIAIRERVTRLESSVKQQSKKIETLFGLFNDRVVPSKSESSLSKAAAGLVTAVTTLVGALAAWLSGVFDP